ncbi:PACE efflux transporter [Tepidicella baoligensis]|uniref:PACE efflux transporter n=1 Tax=Tepidicella baoligensis TaxID=2707016 RepID=UPI001FEC48A6|nr:PACE efflux transporter [Tepidicella baoligensis]
MAESPTASGGQPPAWRRMGPRTRRVVQAVLYETFAVIFVALALALAFDEPAPSALGLSLLTSGIALAWNYVFNGLFERWERRQPVKGRSWRRRVIHGLGFEGGLAILLIPVMAWWLQTTLWLAFLADLGLLLFFLVYTVVFTWVFDKVFGLPQSALQHPD